MKILLVGKGSKSYPSTIGNIVSNIVDSPSFVEDYFYILCAKSKHTAVKNGVNFEHLEYDDFAIEFIEKYEKANIFKKTTIMFKKFLTKIYAKCVTDIDHISYLFAKRKSARMCKNLSFDCVVAIAGTYSSFELANYIAKKKKKPLILFYADPFSPESDSSVLYKKEKKLQDFARGIIMPKPYIKIYKDKGFETIEYKDCLFPSFTKLEDDDETLLKQKNNSTTNKIIYSGSFYRTIREPDEFLKVSKILFEKGYEVHCYGTTKLEMIKKFGESELYNFVQWHKGVSLKELLEIISQSSAVMNVENAQTARFPSKIFQYLSSGKSIIDLDCQKNKAKDYLNQDYVQIISSSSFYDSLQDDLKIENYVDNAIGSFKVEYDKVSLNDEITEKLHKIVSELTL